MASTTVTLARLEDNSTIGTYSLERVTTATVIPVDPESVDVRFPVATSLGEAAALDLCLRHPFEDATIRSEPPLSTLVRLLKLRDIFRVELDHFHTQQRRQSNNVCYGIANEWPGQDAAWLEGFPELQRLTAAMRESVVACLRQGWVTVVETRLSQGERVNWTDTLKQCCWGGQIEGVRMALRPGNHVQSSCFEGCVILATKHLHLDVLQQLAEVEKVGVKNKAPTIAIYATMGGNLPALQWVVETYPAELEHLDAEQTWRMPEGTWVQLFRLSGGCRNTEVMRQLLDKLPEPPSIDVRGKFLLTGIQNGSIDGVRMAVEEFEVDITANDYSMVSAASEAESFEILQQLVERAGPGLLESNTQAVMVGNAANYGEFELRDWVAKYQTKDGKATRIRMTQWLVERDPAHMERNCTRGLLQAVARGNIPLMNWLHERGAVIENGSNVAAVDTLDFRILEWVLERGGDIEMCRECAKGYHEHDVDVLEFLEKYGTGEPLSTEAFYAAIDNEHLCNVHWMLQHGYDVTSDDGTAFRKAARNADILHILIEAGADFEPHRMQCMSQLPKERRERFAELCDGSRVINFDRLQS